MCRRQSIEGRPPCVEARGGFASGSTPRETDQPLVDNYAAAAAGQPTIEDVVPSADVTDDKLYAALQHELQRNYASPEELAAVLRDFGAERLAAYIQDNKLPTKTIIRHGEFGEIVGDALFRRVKGYSIQPRASSISAKKPTSNCLRRCVVE
jgi:hypothetical protein